MNGLGLQLLLCTNGSAASLPALEYGEWLATLAQPPAIILGIVEQASQRGAVEAATEQCRRRLHEARLEAEVRIVEGRAERAITLEAGRGTYLTVVGPLGRPTLRRLALGSSFRRIFASIPTPILLVPRVRLPLRRILVCSGGLSYAIDAERLAVSLASLTGASLTLVHVVEPVTLDYPLAREVEAHWQTLLATDTPQGRNLQAAVKVAEQAGLPIEVRVRRGSPVGEILREIRQDNYDLIAMGSAYSARSLRRLALPNVTAEVAEAAGCPVVTVRAGAAPRASA